MEMDLEPHLLELRMMTQRGDLITGKRGEYYYVFPAQWEPSGHLPSLNAQLPFSAGWEIALLFKAQVLKECQGNEGRKVELCSPPEFFSLLSSMHYWGPLSNLDLFQSYKKMEIDVPAQDPETSNSEIRRPSQVQKKKEMEAEQEASLRSRQNGQNGGKSPTWSTSDGRRRIFRSGSPFLPIQKLISVHLVHCLRWIKSSKVEPAVGR